MIKISELKSLDVINIATGKKLGYVKDIELDLEAGYVTAIVLPGENNFFKIFFKNEDYIIPWENIEKIGDDVVLVNLRE